VLGVLIPAAEEASKYNRIGVLATLGTVASNTFPMEIKKLNSYTKVFQNPAPMLTPLIEEGENALARPFLIKYLKPFANKKLDGFNPIIRTEPVKRKTIMQKELPLNFHIVSSSR